MAKDVQLYLRTVEERAGRAIGAARPGVGRFAAADPDVDFTRIYPLRPMKRSGSRGHDDHGDHGTTRREGRWRRSTSTATSCSTTTRSPCRPSSSSRRTACSSSSDLHIDDATQVAFSQRLGKVEEVVGAASAEIFRVTLDPAKNPAAALPAGHVRLAHRRLHRRHPDHGHRAQRPRVAATGGETEFASSYDAYDALADEEKERAESVRVVHTIEAVPAALQPRSLPEEVAMWRSRPAKEHPLVWRHRPAAGRWCSAPPPTTSSGCRSRRGPGVLDDLLDRSTAPERVYRHEWEVATWSSGTTGGCCTGPCATTPPRPATCTAPPSPATRRSSERCGPIEGIRRASARCHLEWGDDVHAAWPRCAPPVPRQELGGYEANPRGSTCSGPRRVLRADAAYPHVERSHPLHRRSTPGGVKLLVLRYRAPCARVRWPARGAHPRPPQPQRRRRTHGQEPARRRSSVIEPQQYYRAVDSCWPMRRSRRAPGRAGP